MNGKVKTKFPVRGWLIAIGTLLGGVASFMGLSASGCTSQSQKGDGNFMYNSKGDRDSHATYTDSHNSRVDERVSKTVLNDHSVKTETSDNRVQIFDNRFQGDENQVHIETK